MGSTVVEVLEYINIAFIVIFICIYSIRLCHLRHFAYTERYKSNYPKVRILLACVYIVLSVGFLIFNLVTKEFQNPVDYILVGGGGECFDSVILLLQLWVLRRELMKERPYTATHLVYSIYLTTLSLIRFGVVLVRITQGDAEKSVDLGFYLAFMVDAILLLGYWIAKRQQLPEFSENKYFNFEEFQQDSSRMVMNRNIQVSYLRKISDSFNYIRPTVSIQKNKIRIVLETFITTLNDSINTNTVRSSSFAEKLQQSKILQIISNEIYTIDQIKELYKISGRFEIKQKLTFEEVNMFEMYRNLQTFLQELFNQRHFYIEEILLFFGLPHREIQQYQKRLRESIKGSDFDMLANLDKNASLVSVRIYKQLWVQDHYLFYIDVMILQGEESRPMKRYSDFENLHDLLQSINKKLYGGAYKLPPLPKKYLFNWDQSKVNQRRLELQNYLRELTNDHVFMLKLHAIREAVLHFLSFHDLKFIETSAKNSGFYQDLQIYNGSISKGLVGNDYVTFYQFKIFKKGLLLRGLKKRYTDFEILHEALERWMNNTQIQYRLLNLPEKHLYKSETNRQEKLLSYLLILIKIKNIEDVYAINHFFNIGNDSQLDNLSLSDIYISEKQKEKSEKKQLLRKISNSGNLIEPSSKNLNSVDDSSFSSNQRMSALIQELGK